MKKIILIYLTILLGAEVYAQFKPTDPFAHTFSIVARDPETGQMGVAVQSHWFSVGTIVSWAEAGVGAVATQSFVNPSFGPDGLRMIKEGKIAKETLEILINNDQGKDFRQLAIIDLNGNVAAYTGDKCIESAGHYEGDNYSVQANMMLNNKVVPAMRTAFESSEGPLAERLLAALKAAQYVGGDIRGMQSAAIVVVNRESSGKVWQDRIVDLRVDDHENPIEEIERLLKVHRAYEHMNKGDLAIEKGDEEAALREYSAAGSMFPDNLEMKYWHAISLANMKRLEESLPMFKEIFIQDKNWLELTNRIVKNGLLNVDEDSLNKILSVVK